MSCVECTANTSDPRCTPRWLMRCDALGRCRPNWCHITLLSFGIHALFTIVIVVAVWLCVRARRKQAAPERQPMMWS